MTTQMNLLGEKIQKPKSCCYNNNDGDEDFDALEKRIASEYGRKHIGFPCDVAQDMPIDDRPKHIKSCPDCQELLKKLDETVKKK
jgi:hypothetical protein